MHYGLTGEDGNTDIIPAMNVQVTTSEAGTRPIAGSVACGTIGATPINTFLGSNYLPGSKTTQVEVQVTGLSHLAAGSYNGTIYVIAVVY